MADLAYDVNLVRPLPGATFVDRDLGAALGIGAAVYVATDGDVEGADASAVGTALTFLGIIVAIGTMGETEGVAGQKVTICTGGRITGFSGLTQGDVIYLSDTVELLADAAGTVSKVAGMVLEADEIFLRIEAGV